jgi:hypothetical protein
VWILLRLGDVNLCCTIFLYRALVPFRAWHVTSSIPFGSGNTGESLVPGAHHCNVQELKLYMPVHFV